MRAFFSSFAFFYTSTFLAGCFFLCGTIAGAGSAKKSAFNTPLLDFIAALLILVDAADVEALFCIRPLPLASPCLP